jgi:hypothetical protein
MTHGVFLSVATVAAILAAVLVLAVLSSLVFLRTDPRNGARWRCSGRAWR